MARNPAIPLHGIEIHGIETRTQALPKSAGLCTDVVARFRSGWRRGMTTEAASKLKFTGPGARKRGRSGRVHWLWHDLAVALLMGTLGGVFLSLLAALLLMIGLIRSLPL